MTFQESDFPPIHIPGEEILNSEFQYVWKAALALLLNATEVTIIGYSMPAYDLAVKNLFLLTCGRNKQMDISKMITVVNPDSNLKLIYESVFGEPLSFFDVTFAKWFGSARRK